MKTMLIVLLSAILFFSCQSKDSISEIDKRSIEHRIQLHNAVVSGEFAQDSIKEATDFTMAYANVMDTSEFNKAWESQLAVYSGKWNDPYDISKDRFLTYDSYLNYCKTHNYDPVEWKDHLR